MRHKSTGIVAIAEAAGVSPTTVHRALCGTGPVSPATRQRILDLAAELDYRPNHLARSLRRRRTGILGVVTPDLGDRTLNRTYAGIEEFAAPEGYRLVLVSSQSSPSGEQAAIEMLLEQAVEGLVIFPRPVPDNVAYYRGLLNQGVSLVFLAYDPGVEADFVGWDNELAGYLAAQHLAALGRRRLAVLEWHPPAAGQRWWVQQRVAGFLRAAQEHGLEAVVVPFESVENGDHMEAVRRTVLDYCRGQNPLPWEGLFGLVDAFAVGAMEAVQELGKRVPEDLAVVGFDDIDLCRVTRPRLTSFDRCDRVLGREAARLLLERMRAGEDPLPPRRILLEPKLIVRASSGGAASPVGQGPGGKHGRNLAATGGGLGIIPAGERPARGGRWTCLRDVPVSP